MELNDDLGDRPLALDEGDVPEEVQRHLARLRYRCLLGVGAEPCSVDFQVEVLRHVPDTVLDEREERWTEGLGEGHLDASHARGHALEVEPRAYLADRARGDLLEGVVEGVWKEQAQEEPACVGALDVEDQEAMLEDPILGRRMLKRPVVSPVLLLPKHC